MSPAVPLTWCHTTHWSYLDTLHSLLTLFLFLRKRPLPFHKSISVLHNKPNNSLSTYFMSHRHYFIDGQSMTYCQVWFWVRPRNSKLGRRLCQGFQFLRDCPERNRFMRFQLWFFEKEDVPACICFYDVLEPHKPFVDDYKFTNNAGYQTVAEVIY